MEGECPGGPVIATAWTDGSGSYGFTDLPAGVYCLTATSPLLLPSDYEVHLNEGQHVVGVNFWMLP